MTAYYFPTRPRHITPLWAASAHLPTASLEAEAVLQRVGKDEYVFNYAKTSSWVASSSRWYQVLLHDHERTTQHRGLSPCHQTLAEHRTQLRVDLTVCRRAQLFYIS